MKKIKHRLIPLLLLLFPLPAFSLEKIALEVDGVRRETLVYCPPAAREPLPVVFCYHGHGGRAEQFASKLVLEMYWPDSIIVYPQGLNTKGPLVDPEGKKPGWQSSIGAEADRDIRFFDVTLDFLRKTYVVDEQRIFALGFSNGGVFAYTLLAARRESVSAVASIAAVQINDGDRERVIGKSVFHVAGRNDPLVKFSWQAAMVDFLVRKNSCESVETQKAAALKTYQSKDGVRIYFYVDGGAHEIPLASIPLMVDFFKRSY
ncbi:MAG: acetylxylan esterase [Treponemataceae bacterium]